LLAVDIKKGIELLSERKEYLLPVDTWNSVVYSGCIELFEHDQAKMLGDAYFQIQNYSYEAKRLRDASELATTTNNKGAIDRHQKLVTNLNNTTSILIDVLLKLDSERWLQQYDKNV